MEARKETSTDDHPSLARFDDASDVDGTEKKTIHNRKKVVVRKSKVPLHRLMLDFKERKTQWEVENRVEGTRKSVRPKKAPDKFVAGPASVWENSVGSPKEKKQVINKGLQDTPSTTVATANATRAKIRIEDQEVIDRLPDTPPGGAAVVVTQGKILTAQSSNQPGERSKPKRRKRMLTQKQKREILKESNAKLAFKKQDPPSTMELKIRDTMLELRLSSSSDDSSTKERRHEQDRSSTSSSDGKNFDSQRRTKLLAPPSSQYSSKKFPAQLMQMLTSNVAQHALFWIPESNGTVFAVDVAFFRKDERIKYFPGSPFSKITQCLKRWGFARTPKELQEGFVAYQHPLFLREKPELASSIKLLQWKPQEAKAVVAAPENNKLGVMAKPLSKSKSVASREKKEVPVVKPVVSDVAASTKSPAAVTPEKAGPSVPGTGTSKKNSLETYPSSAIAKSTKMFAVTKIDINHRPQAPSRIKEPRHREMNVRRAESGPMKKMKLPGKSPRKSGGMAVNMSHLRLIDPTYGKTEMKQNLQRNMLPKRDKKYDVTERQHEKSLPPSVRIVTMRWKEKEVSRAGPNSMKVENCGSSSSFTVPKEPIVAASSLLIDPSSYSKATDVTSPRRAVDCERERSRKRQKLRLVEKMRYEEKLARHKTAREKLDRKETNASRRAVAKEEEAKRRKRLAEALYSSARPSNEQPVKKMKIEQQQEPTASRVSESSSTGSIGTCLDTTEPPKSTSQDSSFLNAAAYNPRDLLFLQQQLERGSYSRYGIAAGNPPAYAHTATAGNGTNNLFNFDSLGLEQLLLLQSLRR